jgi:hypothetical protein
MRNARIGLLVGYLLLVAGVVAVFIVGRVAPDVGKVGFAVIFTLIAFVSAALALAVFGGSLVCATRSLLHDPSSRRLTGYLTLLLSAASALLLGALYIRGFVIGH